MDIRKIPDTYLKETKVEDGIVTRTYQMRLLHREFPEPLNVVILLKTNLETKAWAHVILFSSDLYLSYDKLIDFYSLRFQIEFNFRIEVSSPTTSKAAPPRTISKANATVA